MKKKDVVVLLDEELLGERGGQSGAHQPESTEMVRVVVTTD